jgi:EmrB/QacA subfamily drug resistance transporter
MTEPDMSTAAGSAMSHREILVVFAALMTGMLLAALDQTIVSTALPTIVGELGGLDHLSWVVTAYLLTSTASTPLYGKLSDLYGRKVVFQAAIVIFLTGSVLSGVATNMVQLIVFRGIQGIGGGGLMTMAFVIIGDVVAPRERGRYTGYLGGVFAVASVAGPLLGGFFVDHLSWRWVFYINVPVGLVALSVTSTRLHLPTRRTEHRIDLQGAALLVGGVTSLLLVTVWGGREYDWGSPTILGLGAAGAALTVAFVAWERRAPEPILPLRLLGDSIFRVGTSASFILGVAMFGAIVFLPLFLQVATGASATSSGLELLPLMTGLLITSIATGRLISRTGHYRTWPPAGMAVAAVGMYLLSGMDADTGRLETSTYMLVVGVGLGMVMQTLVLAVQNAASHEDLGVATSSTTFFRSLGGSFGVAVFGAVFNVHITDELTRRLPPGIGELGDGAARLLNSPEQIRQLPPALRTAVVDAVASSVSTVFLFATPVLLAGVVITLFLRQIPLRESAHVGSARVVDGAEAALPG